MRALDPIAKTRERVKWEGIAVKVILQIEHARKSGAGKLGFAPRAIRILLMNEIGDGFLNGRIIRLCAREQSNQAPGRL